METKHYKVRGNVDRFDMDVISGWALSHESKDPVEIELLVNDQVCGLLKADAFRSDLTKVRADGKFAFRAEIGLSAPPLINCVPKNARAVLRDSVTKLVLTNGTATWNGTAPEDQKGIRNLSGQAYSLAKGKFVIPLRERGVDWKLQMLSQAKLLLDICAKSGYKTCASYGTLLGGVREGRMIPHDDDVDLMYVAQAESMLDAVKEFYAFSEFLKRAGYEVGDLSNGQLHVNVPGIVELPLDIFLAWFENQKLNLTFAVKEGPLREQVLPFSFVSLEGVQLLAPAKPEALLESIYGPHWQTPDPAFQWKRPREVVEYFAPIHNYKRSANNDYWLNYYREKSELSPPENPSQFAIFVLGLEKKFRTIVDLGCGSGRDSFYFASRGLSVVGLDYAQSVIEQNIEKVNSPDVRFIRCDVTNLNDVARILDDDSLRKNGSICIYSRFFFHALDENAEGAALLLVSELLAKSAPGSFAAFEFRTSLDKDRKKITEHHYRRYVNVDHFIKKAEKTYGLQCTYKVEGVGYANWRGDDAHVARLIFEKGAEGEGRQSKYIAWGQVVQTPAGRPPGNSMDLIEAAYQLGFQGIELDVRLTKDHVPVLMHDDEIERETNGSGSIRDLAYEQLQNVVRGKWKGKDVTVASLEAALSVSRRPALILLDMRVDIAGIGSVVDVAKAASVDVGCMMFSVYSVDQGRSVLDALQGANVFLKAYIRAADIADDWLDNASNAGFAGVMFEVRGGDALVAEAVARAHLRSLKVITFVHIVEYGSENIVALSEAGVDYIVSMVLPETTN